MASKVIDINSPVQPVNGLPLYASFNQCSKETGIASSCLRTWAKAGKLKFIMSGNKTYLDTRYLLEVLEREASNSLLKL